MLEERILEQTREFYRKEALILLERESLSGYMVFAKKYLNEELSRCERYLTWDVKDKILKEFR